MLLINAPHSLRLHLARCHVLVRVPRPTNLVTVRLLPLVLLRLVLPLLWVLRESFVCDVWYWCDFRLVRKSLSAGSLPSGLMRALIATACLALETCSASFTTIKVVLLLATSATIPICLRMAPLFVLPWSVAILLTSSVLFVASPVVTPTCVARWVDVALVSVRSKFNGSRLIPSIRSCL